MSPVGGIEEASEPAAAATKCANTCGNPEPRRNANAMRENLVAIPENHRRVSGVRVAREKGGGSMEHVLRSRMERQGRRRAGCTRTRADACMRTHDACMSRICMNREMYEHNRYRHV